MQFILILRELTRHERERVKSLSARAEVQIIAATAFIDEYDNSSSYVTLSDKEKKQINDHLFSSILEFGDSKIDGKSISQHLDFSGAGLWYYHKFRIFFKVRNQQYRIAEMEKNLKAATSAIIFTSEKLKLTLANVEFVLSNNKSSGVIDFWSLLQYGFTVTCRLLKSIFTSSNRFNKKKYLCIDAVTQYRNVLNLDGSDIIFENVFTGYLYQKKGDEIGLIDQLIIPKFKGRDKYRFDLKHLKNHNDRDRMLGERIISRAMLSPAIWQRLYKSRQELHEKYVLLEQSLVNNQDQLQFLAEFRQLETTTLYFLLKFFAYLKFFQNREVHAVLSVDENSANFKAILDAAKQFGVKTIGYQHGNISRFSPNYMYSTKDLEQKPVPDLTITWGEKWSALLRNQGNYTKESLCIAGQLRTDIIKSINDNDALDRQAIVSQIKEKKIVLFATQPQKDESLRRKAAEDAVIACKNQDSVHLIFKVHPREHDLELYTFMAKKHDFQRFSIMLDKELYLLLKVSDVVITCFSTVGTEALYFNKPLIILDHLKEDILEYFKEGVAFQATNSSKLQYYIKGILDGELSIDSSKLEDYVRQSAYKIDGKVAERVWACLSSGNTEFKEIR